MRPCKQVPTLVAYKKGKPIGYGVDAIEQASVQDGELAKWFKVGDPGHGHGFVMLTSSNFTVAFAPR
jgi:hypothetical protein